MGAENGTVVSVDLRTGAESTGVSGSASVSDVDISSDGKLIASAALDGTVTLWQTAHVSAVAELTGAVADYSVAFSPNGQLVAAGDSSGTVVLWDVKTKKSVGKPLTGHNGGVVSVAFDPSGHTLLTASTDGQLRLWDVATRKLIGAPLPGSSTGGNAVFFPDGKHVLGTFSTGTGIVWDVDPTDWNTYACRIANRNLTRTEWTDFLPDRPYRRGCP
jgi:WD40 repeat protein